MRYRKGPIILSEYLLIITALSLGRFVLKENKNVLYFLFVGNFN